MLVIEAASVVLNVEFRGAGSRIIALCERSSVMTTWDEIHAIPFADPAPIPTRGSRLVVHHLYFAVGVGQGGVVIGFECAGIGADQGLVLLRLAL